MQEFNKSITTAQLLNRWKDVPLRIGVLGGTFDPAHYGHVGVSKYMLEHFKLDYVLWIVALHNPHKQTPQESFRVRVESATAMVIDEPQIIVSTIEREIAASTQGSVYTYEVLEYLTQELPYASLHFIMGSDNVLAFHQWKYWQRIVDNAQILVYERAPYNLEAQNVQILHEIKSCHIKEGIDAPLVFCGQKLYDVSSTNLRKLQDIINK